MRNEWGPQCLELAAISLPINLFNSPGEGSDWWTLHTHSLPANKATHMPSQQGPALIWGPCIYRASYWNLKLTGWKDNHQWIESLSKSSGMHIQGVTHAPSLNLYSTTHSHTSLLTRNTHKHSQQHGGSHNDSKHIHNCHQKTSFWWQFKRKWQKRMYTFKWKLKLTPCISTSYSLHSLYCNIWPFVVSYLVILKSLYLNQSNPIQRTFGKKA